jgi:segregation and condensation protein B
MSLKARIEAVIYAAEEPVTLAQLAAIFREDALESRTERIAAEEAAKAEAEKVPENPEAELPEPAETAVEADGEAVAAQEPAESAQAEAAPAEETKTAADEGAESVPAENAAPEGSAEEDEKKAARQRDREIRDEVRRVVDELMADYAAAERGLEIREVAGGFRMATRAEYHDAVRAFVKSLKPPMKLSLQALETLAVIAYKQPVTAPEIGDIRGVDSGGVLGSLVARKLITTAGRKQVIGRPILYKTTREFLLRFGLKDLNELPSIEEFEKMASELAEQEEAEEAPATETELPFEQNEMAAAEDAAEAADSASVEEGAAEASAAPATEEITAATEKVAGEADAAEPEIAGETEEVTAEPEPAADAEGATEAATGLDADVSRTADGEAQETEPAPVEEHQS